MPDTENDISFISYCLYIESLKKIMGANELIYKTELEPQMQKKNLWLPGDKVWEG